MNSRSHARLSENVIFDDDADIANVFGVNIAGEIFRALGEPTPPGKWFRVVRVEDGVATLETKYEESFR
jgi:hypothetical protein